MRPQQGQQHPVTLGEIPAVPAEEGQLDAIHGPSQPLAHFPEHPPGRLTIVGGGCLGEPVKHGG